MKQRGKDRQRAENGARTRRAERKDTPGACAAIPSWEKDAEGWLPLDKERKIPGAKGVTREGATTLARARREVYSRLVGQSFLLRRSFAAVRF